MVYLDTSVLTVLLFGRDREPERFPETTSLFEAIANDRLDGLVSLYALQEIYSFCQDNFPDPDVGEVASLAFRELFQHRVQVCGMLSRQEKILYAKQFSIADASDLPHVITAYVQNCEAILTYDQHFDTITDQIAVFTPGAWLILHPKSDA